MGELSSELEVQFAVEHYGMAEMSIEVKLWGKFGKFSRVTMASGMVG